MLTLTSDFGSPYPAAMRGVLCQWTDARLVDVTHELPRQDVRTAAFWLREVLPYFPPAVHLAVVDPGVGTDRRAIAIRAGDHALVGPDNGLLRPVARALAAAPNNGRHGESSTTTDHSGPETGEGEDDIEVFDVVGFDPESSTFHGRDVFAPAAGMVHESGIGSFHEGDRFVPIDDPVELHFPDPTITDDGAVGEVLAVDDFGNVITNVPGDVLVDSYGGSIAVNDRAIPVARTYAVRDTGDPLATVGSHGNVELAVREGRGDEAFGLGPGDAVEIEW